MKVGLIAGAFDLMHAGHMMTFKEASENCDILVVALHSDPSEENPKKNKPVLTSFERKVILDGIKYIDEIIPYRTEQELHDLQDYMVRDGALHIRFVGEDKQGKGYNGDDIPNLPVHYCRRRHDYSSANIRKRVVEAAK